MRTNCKDDTKGTSAWFNETERTERTSGDTQAAQDAGASRRACRRPRCVCMRGQHTRVRLPCRPPGWTAPAAERRRQQAAPTWVAVLSMNCAPALTAPPTRSLLASLQAAAARGESQQWRCTWEGWAGTQVCNATGMQRCGACMHPPPVCVIVLFIDAQRFNPFYIPHSCHIRGPACAAHGMQHGSPSMQRPGSPTLVRVPDVLLPTEWNTTHAMQRPGSPPTAGTRPQCAP